jgi:release factor glutamine methyltransferase
MSFKTPKLPKINENVYEPAEDTFLLLDAIEQEYPQLIHNMPSLCLEIGSGSGCCITFLASIFGNECLYFATDLNKHACKTTIETSILNNTLVNVVNTSFVDGLLERFRCKVDILLFNPPYVVTGEDELNTKSIEASWAGGLDGRQVIDEFLPLVDCLLSPKGF